MNLLIDSVPDYLVIDGEKMPIKTDFSLWVKFIVASDKQEQNALNEVLIDIFGGMPDRFAPQSVLRAMMDWLNLKNEDEPIMIASGGKTTQSKPFDFASDGNTIYAELWEHFPALMQRGINFHEGMELIKLLMANDKTQTHHKAFARCGDFSKMSKEQRKYWQEERARYRIRQVQTEDAIASFF